MRSAVIEYLTSSAGKDWRVSTQLPWSDGNVELYKKNPRTLYVATPTRDQEPLYTVFGGRQVIRETRTLQIFVAVDVKRQPDSLPDLITTVANTSEIKEFKLVHNRTVALDQRLEDELLVLEFTITLVSTINNI